MLKGTLDDFTLADIFRLMSLARRTGKLEVVRSAGRGKVFVREGEVYYAESSLVREPLGQKLIRSGALTEGALMKALDENAASGKRVGEVLVESGAISYEQLQKALQQQIEDAVFDLLRWDLGEFAWEPGVIAEVEVNIAVSVENLIIEASRRMDELEVIGRKIPSAASILTMAHTPPEGAAEINITPEEWRMLVLVDGTRSVHDIAVQVGVDDLTALRSLYGLVSAGLVEVEEGRDSIDAAGRQGEQVRGFSRSSDDGDDGDVAAATGSDASAGFEAPAQIQEAESALVEEMPGEPVPGSPEDLVAMPEAPTETELVGEEISAAHAEQASEDPSVEIEESEQPVAAGEVPVPEDHDRVETEAPFEGMPVGEGALEIEPESVARQIDGEGETGPDEPLIGDPLFEAADSQIGIEEFDAPGQDELVSAAPSDPGPGSDPFLNELLSAGSAPSDEQVEGPAGEEPAAEEPASEQPVSLEPITEEPITEEPAESVSETGELPEEPAASGEPAPPPAPTESPSVDRASVVRELAGLFDDDRPRAKRSQADGAEGGGSDAREPQPRRIEDDDQLNKGLIGRLIDGVKGL